MSIGDPVLEADNDMRIESNSEQTEHDIVEPLWQDVPYSISVLGYLFSKFYRLGEEAINLTWNQPDWAKTALVGLKVTFKLKTREDREKRRNQIFTVRGLSEEVTEYIHFEKYDKRISLVGYLEDKYGRGIDYRHWQCLDLGKKKNIYVPMEFCQIYHKHNVVSRKLKNKLWSEATPAEKRSSIFIKIRDWNPYTANENIEIKDVGDMTKIVALKEKKKSVERWGILYFEESRDPFCECVRKETVDYIRRFFQSKFVDWCKWFGIGLSQNLEIETVNIDSLSNWSELTEILLNVQKGLGLQLLVCVLDRKHKGYKTLKHIAENGMGLLTQCCLVENVKNHLDVLEDIKEKEKEVLNKIEQEEEEGKKKEIKEKWDKEEKIELKKKTYFISNLALKLNAKLGMSNAIRERRPCPFFAKKKKSRCPFPKRVGDDGRCKVCQIFGKDDVIYFGGCTIHLPGPPKSSVAALVASWPSCNQYIMRIRYQEQRGECIEQLGDMAKELLEEYMKRNRKGQLPDRILYFRDGFDITDDKEKYKNKDKKKDKEKDENDKPDISKPKLKEMLNKELLALEHTFDKLLGGYDPRISFILAHTKRYKSENKKGENKANKKGEGGSVISGGVNGNQNGNGGGEINRLPTRYYKFVLNENEISRDNLRELIKHLCFFSGRGKQPVSLAPPLYYAHLAARRGKQSLEVSPTCHLQDQKIDQNLMFYC